MTTGGFSTERLGRLRAALSRHVESGTLPGAVALVSRRGETHVEAVGATSCGGSEPMRRDTIFRIASLTKPVVAAAAMTLVEECVLRLDDPVDPWLPELAGRRVLRSLESALDDTVPAERPITLRDLLTFRAGIGAVMEFPPRHPIQHAMQEAGLAPSAELSSHPPDEMMRRFGGLPLVHQPGERWLYHSGSDILGVLLARASGKPLEALLSERIFGPLGMRDTGFHVPADKLDRLPPCYGNDPGNSGRPVLFDDAGANSRFARPPVFPSGGSGLVSTGDDYLAFCRMLLGNGRAPGGCRVLSRPAVELMTADHLTPGQKAASPFFPNFWDTRGWGFGLSVITRRDELGRSVGAFGWDGGYGTSAYSGPPEGLVGVLLTQRIIDYPEGPAVFQDFWASAYQAIDD